jgi:hypothetical protein
MLQAARVPPEVQSASSALAKRMACRSLPRPPRAEDEQLEKIVVCLRKMVAERTMTILHDEKRTDNDNS